MLFKIPSDTLEFAYKDIFSVFKDAEEYVKIWFNYEALWIIDSKKIYDKLGDDIAALGAHVVAVSRRRRFIRRIRAFWMARISG